MGKGVILPKKVYIENFKLWCLHRIFLLCALVGIVAQYVFFKVHIQLTEFGGIRGTVWLQAPNTNDLGAEQQHMVRSELCRSAMLLPFQHGSGDHAQLQGCTHSCLYGDKNCKHPSILFQEEGESQVMLSTRISEVTSNADGSGLTRFDRFVPEVTLQQIALSYSLTGPSKQNVSSMMNAQTQLRKGGHVIRTYSPGESITFSVPELLDLAGHPDALMQPNPWMANGTIGFATGIEIALSVSCDELGVNVPRCNLDIVRTPLPWVSSSSVTEMPDGSVRKRTVYGVRISTMTRATVSHINTSSVFRSIVDSLVIIMIPGKVVYFFAILFLGHLSKIYTHVATEMFFLEDQIAHIVSRLVSNNVVWSELQNDDGHMSKERMYHWMKRVCVCDTLDDTELADLTNLCYNAILTVGQKSDTLERATDLFTLPLQALDLGKDGKQLGIVPPSSSKETTCISGKDFSLACASLERVRLKDVAKLFDVDRSKSLLERWFEPVTLRKYVFRKKEYRRMLQKRSSLRRSSRDSIASVCIDDTVSDIQSLKSRTSIMSDIDSISCDLAEKIARIEGIIEAQSAPMRQMQSTVNQHVEQIFNLQQTVAQSNLGHNDKMHLLDRVGELERFVENAKDDAKIIESAENLVRTYSLISEELTVFLQMSKQGCFPRTCIAEADEEEAAKHETMGQYNFSSESGHSVHGV